MRFHSSNWVYIFLFMIVKFARFQEFERVLFARFQDFGDGRFTHFQDYRQIVACNFVILCHEMCELGVGVLCSGVLVCFVVGRVGLRKGGRGRDEALWRNILFDLILCRHS